MERSRCHGQFYIRLGRASLRGLRCCVALALAAASAGGASFSLSLDRSTVVVGEPFGVSLNFEGAKLQGNPTLPNIPGVRNISPGVSSSFSSSTDASGQTVTVQSYKYTLIADQPGEVTFPPLQVQVGGEILSSQPVTLRVLKEDPSSPPAQMALRPTFVWLVLPKEELFVGEVIVAELRLYVRSGVRNIANVQMPSVGGSGFTSGKLVEGSNFQRKVGATLFTVVPLTLTLTPVKSGLLTLDASTGSVVLNPRDPFDFFNRQSPPQQASLELPARTVKVLPLPTTNVPPMFAGAVGKYTMEVTAGPTNVATGDPITVRVVLSGRGALENVKLPEQASWHDFKTYPPTQNVETGDALGIEGTKTFEQIVTPESADIRELPAIEFAYFDPDARTYRTLRHPPIPLSVRPGGSSPSPVAIGIRPPQAAAAPRQDIVPIKQRIGTLAHVGQPLMLRPWFLGGQTIPVLVWLAAVIWQKRSEAWARNPRLRRKQQVARTVASGIQHLREFAAQNNSDEFFATLFRVLQEQIGERLNVPASSITEAVVDEQLKTAGLAEPDCIALHDLFQTCNLARYAPIKSSQELAALVPRVELMITKLRGLRA